MARPPHHPIDSLTSARGRVYAAAAASFAAFAIWGSWFPFTVRPMPLDVAVEVLRASATPPYWSLSDAFSNLLLFIPIGLFAAALMIHRTTTWRGTIAVIAAGAALSTVLELGQLLVPWRTPSVLDIAAETMGVSGGVAAWHVTTHDLDALTDRLISAWRRARAIERSLWLYAGVFVLAWLLPFDFTIRPEEIADKYAHKRLLLPGMASPDAAGTWELWLTAMAAVPLGCAGVICTRGLHRRAAVTSVVGGAVILVTLTLVQITVFSRTTDGTATLAAIGGLGVGAALVSRRRAHAAARLI
jgi:VanZ family protein